MATAWSRTRLLRSRHPMVSKTTLGATTGTWRESPTSGALGVLVDGLEGDAPRPGRVDFNSVRACLNCVAVVAWLQRRYNSATAPLGGRLRPQEALVDQGGHLRVRLVGGHLRFE
eukprot:317236-Prymnesium_polylepis.1